MEQILISFSKNDFQDLIAGTVNACLKRNLQPNPTPTETELLLTVKEAAKFLSLSVPTIYGLISKNEIPFMKRSKRCYFSKIELMEYVKQGRRKTTAEIEAETDAFIRSKKKGGANG